MEVEFEQFSNEIKVLYEFDSELLLQHRSCEGAQTFPNLFEIL
jgi:hypothetical protein